MSEPLPSPERVHAVLDYNPDTGVFTWLVSTSNRVKVGRVAGSLSHGYWEIGLDRNHLPAHILAWFYVTGTWPTHEIDHIDGNPLNNAFANLRDVPSTTNKHNIVAPNKNNRSGLRGVFPARSRWAAQLIVRGRKMHLGTFDTPEEASAAYWAAKAEHHGEDSYQVRRDTEGA